jgi:hypothetical protein
MFNIYENCKLFESTDYQMYYECVNSCKEFLYKDMFIRDRLIGLIFFLTISMLILYFYREYIKKKLSSQF